MVRVRDGFRPVVEAVEDDEAVADDADLVSGLTGRRLGEPWRSVSLVAEDSADAAVGFRTDLERAMEDMLDLERSPLGQRFRTRRGEGDGMRVEVGGGRELPR